MYKPHRLTVQPLSLSAMPNIISSLDQGSCQGKLLCVRWLQNVIFSFYYIIISNLSVLRLSSFCVSGFGACCLCMLCPRPNCIWKTSRETSQHLLRSPSLSLTVKQNWNPLVMKFLSITKDSVVPKYLGKHTVSFLFDCFYLWNWVNCNMITQKKKERKLFSC